MTTQITISLLIILLVLTGCCCRQLTKNEPESHHQHAKIEIEGEKYDIFWNGTNEAAAIRENGQKIISYTRLNSENFVVVYEDGTDAKVSNNVMAALIDAGHILIPQK